MTITANQLAARSQGIGASEMGAVLGLDPYRTPYDVWLVKTGQVEEPEFPGEAAEIGNAVEGAVLSLAAKRLGRRVVRPTATFKARNGVMFANIDGMLDKAERGSPLVEAKSTGISDGWGEPGTDVVPDRVLIQVHAQFICSGSRFAHVARLLGRFGFSFDLYPIERNDDLCSVIEHRACAFWRNVERDVPPEGLPSLDVVSRRAREPGKVVAIDPEVIEAFVKAKQAKKAAEDAEQSAKAAVIAALGDAESGTAPGFLVSFRSITTNRVDVDALRAAQPELVGTFTKPSGYRRLDVRERKA